MTLISIVVPSFNYVDFIGPCLESIRLQRYANFEVLICDGGSTDGTLDIIESYEKLDARFRIISRNDQGQSDAIHKGFNASNGDVFCFLNADDIFLNPEVFDQVINEFDRDNGLGIVSCSGFYIDERGGTIKKINYHYHPLVGRDEIGFRLAVLQPATFWKRNIFFHGVWRRDMHYVFDAVFFYYAFKQNKWIYLDLPVAGYRIHDSNKSVGVKAQRVLELLEFEKMKFGEGSLRARYLSFVCKLVDLSDRSRHKLVLQRIIYFSVNSISFITCYRLPSI